MTNKLYSMIAKIMDVPESDINDQSGPETIANWTSFNSCLLYTSPSPRDATLSRMPSSA